MLVSSINSRKSRPSNHKNCTAKPYCKCWIQRPLSRKPLRDCSCGEDNIAEEWKWHVPKNVSPSWIVVNDDAKQVTFHPYYSSGTAAVRGDTELKHNYHYYWEIKMLSDTYGTDIMIGVGTDKVSLAESPVFRSLLGSDTESYGLSYRGTARHGGATARNGTGFCRGTIIGVRVDMWRGTLEFYINRRPQGITFFNLRRHQQLYPMACSTAAQSSLRLTYAASWRASLLVEAARALAAARRATKVPPGLWYTMRNQFWLTLPTEGCVLDDGDDPESEPEQMEVAPAPARLVSDVTDLTDAESISDVDDIYFGC